MNKREYIESLNLETLFADGFDEAIIGHCEVEGNTKVCYSVEKCLEILVGQGMEYEEAREYFDFNVSGSYMGEVTPIWVE